MIRSNRRWFFLATIFCCAGVNPPSEKIISRIDLSKPFRLPPGASFTAIQWPDVADPIFDDEKVAGRIRLCVRSGPAGQCMLGLNQSLNDAYPGLFREIHYLERAEVVYPHGRFDAPLLLVQVGSLHSGNGNQNRAAVVVAYRTHSHRFDTIFHDQVSSNNNEEIRYMESGALKGAVIVAESPYGPPFNYVVKVNRLTPDYRYKQVLKYRSATRYGDGNPLAVIDSEMPGIQHRLGLWKPGQPLPLPQGGCPKPHLAKKELWCS